MKKCKKTIGHELENIGISFLCDDYVAVAAASKELEEKEDSLHGDVFIEEGICITWNIINTTKGEQFLFYSENELVEFWFSILSKET